MKYARLLVFSCIAVVVVVFKVPLSWALESAQEEKYQSAQILLKDGKLEDALSIFSHLSADNPSHLGSRLGVINTTIEQSRVLKADNDSAWQDKIYQAFGDLKMIYRANITLPEMYLSFAKCYWVNNRIGKAEKSLRKAFYYKPNYTEAFIFQGNMYFEEGNEIKNIYDDDEDSSFEDYRGKAKESYLKALSAANIDDETKGMVYYKLGKTYFDLYNSEIRAREEWNKAASISQESSWGKKAQNELSALK